MGWKGRHSGRKNRKGVSRIESSAIDRESGPGSKD